MTLPLAGKRALVTGASRGIGRGVAVGLAAAGARVVATGRSADALRETAALASAAGGLCEARVLDSGNDGDVYEFFADLGREGGVDIVVSNAYAGVGAIVSNMGKDFWEKKVRENEEPGEYWDSICRVGLRSNYIAIVRAVRLMREAGTGGLIVNISSFGCV